MSLQKIQNFINIGRIRERVLKETFEEIFSDENILDLFTYEIFKQTENKFSVRLNIVKIHCKTSGVRFLVNGKKTEIENLFQKKFSEQISEGVKKDGDKSFIGKEELLQLVVS